MPEPRAQTAVALVEQHLQALPHDNGLVRLTMFSHDSEGVRKYKRQIAEAVIGLLESNGYHICNGLTEALALLESAGYAVTPPSDESAPDGVTGSNAD